MSYPREILNISFYGNEKVLACKDQKAYKKLRKLYLLGAWLGICKLRRNSHFQSSIKLFWCIVETLVGQAYHALLSLYPPKFHSVPAQNAMQLEQT